MALDSLLKALIRVQLFQGLKPLQISEIARHAYRTVYKPGDTIIVAGTNGDAAVLIVSGEAVRVLGPDAAFSGERIPEGTLLGEMAMLIETEHTSTVVAKTQVRALRIARSDIHDQMADDPDLAQHFISRISHRLRDVAHELRRIDQTLSPAAAPPRGFKGPLQSSSTRDGRPAPEQTFIH